MKPVHIIRFRDGENRFVKSFGLTVNGGEVHTTFSPFEALHFGSWEEAAAVASFIVFHVDEEYEGEFEVATYFLLCSCSAGVNISLRRQIKNE